VWGYFDALPKGSPHHRPSHWALSPPPALVERLELENPESPGAFLEALREAGREAFTQAGLKGALVLYHPYRLVGDDDKTGRWRWVRAQENWRDYVRFSPHFHLIAYGYLPNTGIFNSKTGWVLKKIRNLDDQGDTEDLLMYLLSHVGVIPFKKMVSYWGCLSSRYLKCVKVETTKEEEMCEICGAPMIIYEIDLHGVPIPTGRPVLTYRITRTYELTAPARGYPPAPRSPARGGGTAAQAGE